VTKLQCKLLYVERKIDREKEIDRGGRMGEEKEETGEDRGEDGERYHWQPAKSISSFALYHTS